MVVEQQAEYYMPVAAQVALKAQLATTMLYKPLQVMVAVPLMVYYMQVVVQAVQKAVLQIIIQ